MPSLQIPAPPAGFEPATSSLTTRRALQAAPRRRDRCDGSGGIRTLSISHSEREWSASCLPSRKHLDAVDSVPRVGFEPTAPGFKPGRSAVGVPGLSEAEAVGLEPTSGPAATCFQDRPLIRPVGFREGIRTSSSGGWNRTSGLHVQSVASLPAATAPESFGKEDSNLHRLIQSQGACRLADSRVRAPRGSRTRLSGLGSPRLAARPGTHQPSRRSRAGSGIRTPVAWLEARSRAAGPIPQCSSQGGRRGSRTLKAHRSPDFESGAVALRLALPHRRAPAAGIEPASSRLTAGRSYQHELHRIHDHRARQSGRLDTVRTFSGRCPELGS